MKLVVLYPGAMKPFHDGHLSLLESYISNNDNIIPYIVHIIISPTNRSGITAATTEKFIKAIDFSKINKSCDIHIQVAESNPIVACYAICGHCEDPNVRFTLASSVKGDDAKRGEYFKSLFSRGGKYYNENFPERVLKISVNQNPLVYKNRSDDYNHKPVSSTIVRYDIVNNDYDNFKTAYNNMLNRGLITDVVLHEYYNNLRNEVELSKKDIKKLNDLLHESFNDKQNIKTNKIYPMNRRLNEGVETIKLNITDMASDCPNVDFNVLRDTLTDMGATVMGQIGNGDLQEAEGDDDNVYMIVDGLSEKDVKDAMIDTISQYEDDVTDIAPESYFVNDDMINSVDDIDTDEIPAYDEDDEIPVNDEDDEIPVNDEDDTVSSEDFPEYDDIDIEDEDGFPAWDDVEEYDINDAVDSDDEYEYWDAENSCFIPRKDNTLTEKRRGCCPKKKYQMINLSEALKAFDPKKQKKVDDAVKNIEDIIKSVKGQSIGAQEVADAFKKLKAEHNKLKKIEKNKVGDRLSITDVPGVSSAFKKMAEADPSKADEIKKYQKSLKEAVQNALINNREYLHENVKVNGKMLKKYSIKELKKLMMEANSTKIKLTKKLKDNALNESVVIKTELKRKIANKIRLINVLDEELTYRVIRKRCLLKLNESDENNAGDFTEDSLSKMFGGGQGEDENDKGSKGKSDKDDEDEIIDLARVVITMEDEEAAEDLKKSCLDAGIPEDAIEIEDGSEEEEESEEESEENSEETEDTEESTESKSEKSEKKNKQSNESVKYKNLKRLFEEDEAESDDESAEETEDNDDSDTEETSEEDDEEQEGGVKFILIDTDYVQDLAKILDDEYGITKEEFEEMIGGKIVDDEEESESESDDETKEDSEESEDEDQPEDDIDPSELFKGL